MEFAGNDLEEKEITIGGNIVNDNIVNGDIVNENIVNETFIHDAFVKAHRCSYCGGKFTGYLKKRCVRCGRYKNYK